MLGRDPRYTEGVVSALSAVGPEDALFQMTVPVQPGNSGGAVVSNDGRVVGVVVSQQAVATFLARTGTLPQSINWAVKADYAIPLFAPPPGEVQLKTRREAIDNAVRATCMVEAEK
jgi:S1-C subfamily serine protease